MGYFYMVSFVRLETKSLEVSLVSKCIYAACCLYVVIGSTLIIAIQAIIYILLALWHYLLHCGITFLHCVSINCIFTYIVALLLAFSPYYLHMWHYYLHCGTITCIFALLLAFVALIPFFKYYVLYINVMFYVMHKA